MRTFAVSVGRTTTLEIKGQPVHTAILKTPCDGAVAITAAGVDGNDVAVHTDAVYAIAREHYAYWAGELGAAPDAWQPGHFGENLTIEGLDERELRVGDRLRVGDELELVVAGPRVPCFKLAWRMQQPDSFVQRFASSGRTGVYFGVVRAGSARAGDSVQLVQRGTHPTVAEVTAMIFGAADPPVEMLRALLALPCLSQTVALALRNRLYGILDVVETRRDRWSGWRPLRIARVVRDSADVDSFELVAADDEPLPRFRAGQFLTLRLPCAEGPVERTWSLSDFDERPTRYRISVRHGTGPGTRWMREHAHAGAVVDARPPAGRFVLDRGTFRPVILVGAGIGITPLLAMAKSHLARGADAPRLYLVHCVRDGERRVFGDEIAALAQAGARVAVVCSRPGSNELEGRDYTARGRLDLPTLERLLADTHIVHGGRRVDLPWYDCDVYLCGPRAFEDALLDAMAARGIDRSRVRTESFVAPAAAALPRNGVARASVTLARSGASYAWDATRDGTLLEFLESQGLRPESGCRSGLCHACRCTRLAGEVAHDVATDGLGPGDVLLCRARPTSEQVTLDL